MIEFITNACLMFTFVVMWEDIIRWAYARTAESCSHSGDLREGKP